MFIRQLSSRIGNGIHSGCGEHIQEHFDLKWGLDFPPHVC